MEVLEKIKTLLAAHEAAKKELTAELRTEFPKLFGSAFELNPEVETVAFNQYTPYFNDGDECIFSANVDPLLINGRDYYDTDKFPKSVFQQFEAVLSQVPEEFLKQLFGDHVEVTVKKDGSIEIEGYDHD